MRLTTATYQLAMGVFKIMPFKKQVCILIKWIGTPPEKFYRDLKFEGPFTVKASPTAQFTLFHHRSTIENELFWNGLGKKWEEDTVWILSELGKTSSVFFDVGANSGVYSLMIKALNPNCEIHSFEPIARTYKFLEQNIALNKGVIKAVPVAASNKTGKQVIYDTPVVHQQSSSLSADKLKNTDWNTDEIIEYEINTIRLDDYIDQNGIKQLDLIKIDVEMHEPEVIEGFQKYIGVFNPYIVIEVLEDSVAKKLDAYFANPAYRIFHLSGRNQLVPKEKFEVVRNQWNYLVCKPEQVERVKAFIN